MLRLSTWKVEPSRKPSLSAAMAAVETPRARDRDAAQAGFFLSKRMDSFLLLEHDEDGAGRGLARRCRVPQ
ncbi:hypothetical protein GCM10027514_05540 [Azotobacter armeniacus]